MLHPAWQFDHRRQDTHPGLPLVLAALSEVAADGLDADAIATTPRADADGACVAQLLAAGDPVAAATRTGWLVARSAPHRSRGRIRC